MFYTNSLNNTTIGTIDPASGLFTALSSGTATVTAATTNTGAATWTGTTTVSVQNAPSVLEKINVTPPNPTINSGTTHQFSAETLDQYGHPINVSVIWSSDNPSVGTVDSISGLVTGVSPGTATVTATSGLVQGNTTFAVQNAPPAVATINVSPSNPSVTVGSKQQFSAAALDQYGDPIQANISWTSSNKSVGKIDSSGLFSGENPGIATITASSGTVGGNTQISVNPVPKTASDLSILGIGASNITKNSIRINWETNADSIGFINFGQKKKKLTAKISADNPSQNQAVTLTKLKKNKKYYFQITTNLPDGSKQIKSGILAFRTKKK